jgi:hypothetical protein
MVSNWAWASPILMSSGIMSFEWRNFSKFDRQSPRDAGGGGVHNSHPLMYILADQSNFATSGFPLVVGLPPELPVAAARVSPESTAYTPVTSSAE